MATDPILSEIEVQLDLVAAQLAVAGRAVANARAFVARVNVDREPNEPRTDPDGDEPFETYDDTPAFASPSPTTNGGRNGRKNTKRR